MYVLRIDIYEKYIKRQLCAFFMLLFSDYADELEVVINSLLIQLFFLFSRTGNSENTCRTSRIDTWY